MPRNLGIAPRAGAVEPEADFPHSAGRAERARGEASDDALVRDFQTGDRRAFDQIVSRYKDRMYQFARWQVGSAAADDAAQEIFIQVLRSTRRFDGKSSFRTWLYAVARNVCRSFLRRRGGTRQVSIEEREDLLEIPDPAADPFEKIERRELRAAVRRAVEELPPHHKTTLMLRDWEGMTYHQISEALELPIGTVRSRLHNARAAIAGELLRDPTAG